MRAGAVHVGRYRATMVGSSSEGDCKKRSGENADGNESPTGSHLFPTALLDSHIRGHSNGPAYDMG